jgi:small subunit ribosomal protein S17
MAPETTTEKPRGARKERTGVVVSDKMDKTIIVAVERRFRHPVYKKYVRKTTRLTAHDKDNTCRVGDRVRIIECRPLSKNKCWRLAEVVERAK